jgi:hypothetical protein
LAHADALLDEVTYKNEEIFSGKGIIFQQAFRASILFSELNSQIQDSLADLVNKTIIISSIEP